MRIDQEVKYDFQDVLIRPRRSNMESRKEVDLERTFTFLHSDKVWRGVPIIASNMDTTGTFQMARELSKFKIITALNKFYSINSLELFFKKFNNPNYIAYSLGIREEDFEKFDLVLSKGLSKYFNFICLDVPNAYLEKVVEKLILIRKRCPNHIIIAGNVVTSEMTEELLLSGADVVKIGIGSGSVCTTRMKTGVGFPQLSAVIESADSAHGVSNENSGCGLIISDGGAVYPSCVAKAFGAGSDFVMLGSLFAGFKQSGGKLFKLNGKLYKEYYGMSSSKAMKTHYGGVAKHRASEGRDLKIPYKGDVNNFVLDLLGSLRSTGTYIGARRLKDFSKRTTFMLVNRQLNKSLEKFDS